MKVTYIYHSCYLLEFEDFIVVIDFFKDVIKEDENIFWIKDYTLNQDKELYVFSTHSHGDHYNPEILTWKSIKNDIHYIFSKEIKDSLNLEDNQIVFLDKFQKYKDNNLSVTAFGSTDVGASFLLEVEGKKIFHAGDLNNWHWNEEVPVPEATGYETCFLCELELLAENIDQLFLAMFPIDPRLGKDYMLGAEQLLKRFSIDYLLPMHFGDNYDKANAIANFAKLQNCKYLEVHKKGESYKI